MSGVTFHPMSDDYAVCASVAEADLRRAHELGFAMVINNRHDDETSEQLSSDEAAQIAAQLGMAYAHIPIQGSAVSESDLTALHEARTRANGPVLAYCGSGRRSSLLWAMNEVAEGRMSPDEVLKRAQSEGYDLHPIRPQLEALYTL